MIEDRWIGLALAICSPLAIGTSFIITKKGLINSADNTLSTASSDTYAYLRNPTWWAGMIVMIAGETANFAAYTFAPPILVTPLGALSVLIGAVLASVFLNERLGKVGRIGCTLCLLGSLVIILHAPQDKEVQTVDEILNYALQPFFILYLLLACSISAYLIFKVAPVHGTRNPVVYLTICSLAGSISVMAIKGFGIAIKLTFAGNNQLGHFSTYLFGIVVVLCILVQMNYFNKALDIFSTNVVNPIYYVLFSTSTLIASFILFKGFNTASGVDDVSLLLGFIIIFLGVYLLNISRANPDNDPVSPDSQSILPSHHSRPSYSQQSPSTVLETGVFPRMSISGHRRSISQDYQLTPSTRNNPNSPISSNNPTSNNNNRTRSSRYNSTGIADSTDTTVLFDETEELSDDDEETPLNHNSSSNSNPNNKNSRQQKNTLPINSR